MEERIVSIIQYIQDILPRINATKGKLSIFILSTHSADDGNSIFLFKIFFLDMIKIFQQCM